MSETIKKVRIYEMVAEKIKELITGGRYQVGDLLPTEREFAELYGVSRSAVREAMIVLHRQGMLDNTPGRGTVVKRVTEPSVRERLIDLFQKEDSGVLDILELRKGIEIEAASLAARRCSDSDLKKLKEKYRLLEEAVNRGEIGAREDQDFHTMLAKMTKNTLYVSVMSAISGVMYISLERTRSETMTRPGGPAIVLSEHEAILKAIEKRDENETRKAMRIHLDSVMEKIKDHFGIDNLKGFEKQAN